jgi:hypothetical protein
MTALNKWADLLEQIMMLRFIVFAASSAIVHAVAVGRLLGSPIVA